MQREIEIFLMDLRKKILSYINKSVPLFFFRQSIICPYIEEYSYIGDEGVSSYNISTSKGFSDIPILRTENLKLYITDEESLMLVYDKYGKSVWEKEMLLCDVILSILSTKIICELSNRLLNELELNVSEILLHKKIKVKAVIELRESLQYVYNILISTLSNIEEQIDDSNSHLNDLIKYVTKEMNSFNFSKIILSQVNKIKATIENSLKIHKEIMKKLQGTGEIMLLKENRSLQKVTIALTIVSIIVAIITIIVSK